MPLNPRIFVEHNNYPFNSKTYDISLENIKVLFRWNAPVSRHLIESYRVSCSFSNQFGESQYCRSPILENCTLHYETNDVPANSTVHLKVKYCIPLYSNNEWEIAHMYCNMCHY
ncbi:hypothetical protein M8J75_013237 [Diaphorina citri]|nr:hypothetical protein M8J75_013237 [Diaphorina citri]